nr:hypothetical protein BaRGS_033835 [Batillaria attramentaria]
MLHEVCNLNLFLVGEVLSTLQQDLNDVSQAVSLSNMYWDVSLVWTNGQYPPLTLNQLAIVAASQNKLPTSRVKGIVARMGRHTQSSAKKLGRWYKGDNYVDNGKYSWRNMELFADYQKQMYNAEGTIKASCKK